ncbi:polynucleotide adenylyltransferase [Spirochaetia bacterium]|nr:polynucleotide adenylyltransferase [Spirochaetia bacterium]GHV22293.1 polynucleotide adenylyltransferase [Spirochaetia bacterium]
MRFRYSKGADGKTVKIATVWTADEHNINISDVDSDATYICSRLHIEGFESYIVGGAVRDLILGKKPKDFDIASAATPQQIKKIFRNSRIIGRRFRLVHVFFGPKIIEVATFRSTKDGGTGNTFGTIAEDVRRRDFSLNALFYDPERQLVIDFVGGLKDINQKKIRPVIDPKIIFKDDPVRMIRAVKYSVSCNFSLPFFLRTKIKSEAGLLSTVSPSRLTEEINKIIYSACTALIVEQLVQLGLYSYLQPEASALIKRSELFKEHYFSTLKKLNDDKNSSREDERRYILSIAALFRDYVEDCVDWTQPPVELYKATFIAARKFVLPMNPQRLYLEKAIRLIISEHGVVLRKVRRCKSATLVINQTEEGATAARRRRRKDFTQQQQQTIIQFPEIQQEELQQ